MRVLIIEDYSPLREASTEYLEESGYIIDSSGCGAEGLWYAENHSYDAILLDIMLPEIDGLTILKKLRDQQNSVPIIITSARDAIDQRVDGLRKGADDYLVKPYDLEELKARIEVQLRKQTKSSDSNLCIGALRIHIPSKTLYVNESAVELTKREFHLLEFLCYRRNQVVSRTEIWDHVYQDYEGGSSNLVDVYIGYLRKKLKPFGAANYLQTKRGMGYMLQEVSP